MLGPFATARRLTPIHQGSLAVLSRAACASMSTTSTTIITVMAPWNGPNEMGDMSIPLDSWFGVGRTTATDASTQCTFQSPCDVWTVVARHERHMAAVRAVTGNVTTSGHRYVVHFFGSATILLIVWVVLRRSTTYCCHSSLLRSPCTVYPKVKVKYTVNQKTGH